MTKNGAQSSGITLMKRPYDCKSSNAAVHISISVHKCIATKQIRWKELKTESHAHTHQQVTAVALNVNVNAKWYDNSVVPRIFNCIRYEANENEISHKTKTSTSTAKKTSIPTNAQGEYNY